MLCSRQHITMSVFFKLCEDVRETGPVEWQGYRVRCVSVWPHRHVSRVYLQWKHEFLSPTLYTSMGMKLLNTWFQSSTLLTIKHRVSGGNRTEALGGFLACWSQISGCSVSKYRFRCSNALPIDVLNEPFITVWHK